MLPHESASCLPSGEKAKFKMRDCLKPFTGTVAPPTGCRLVTEFKTIQSPRGAVEEKNGETIVFNPEMTGTTAILRRHETLITPPQTRF